MRSQLNKILALGSLFLMLSFTADGKIACYFCPSVNLDNSCKKDYYPHCETNGFCYVRRTSKDGKGTQVMRGCTRICKKVVNLRNSWRIHDWCCNKNYCNTYNPWMQNVHA